MDGAVGTAASETGKGRFAVTAMQPKGWETQRGKGGQEDASST